MLHSEPTPTFSSSSSPDPDSLFDPPKTWDCITVVSSFPNVVPAHPLDILPRIKPEPFRLDSLLRSYPYTTHRFTQFRPFRIDHDDTELRLPPRPHLTHAHTLEHRTFCREAVCPTHYPYGGNRRAK